MSPKLTWIYSVVSETDKNKFREQIVDYAEQGFEVQEISTCPIPTVTTQKLNGFGQPETFTMAGVVYTALMRKRPEAPQIEDGPDPTGGTPAAGKVIPFRNLLVKAAA